MPKCDNPLVIDLVVNTEESHQRIDKFLSKHPKISSRNRAAKLISKNLVSVNDQAVKSSYILQPGERVRVQLPPPTPTDLDPYFIDLDIYYEDEHLLVVNKPAGLVVHPSHGHEGDTLVNALVAHCSHLAMGFEENRPGIVHRLDKDTSGLLVVAKDDFVHRGLSQQFKNRTVLRRYQALALGRPRLSHGKIVSHLIRHPVHRKRFCSAETIKKNPDLGKVAITNYEVLADYHQQICLIQCRLETGRTHQIRVHLSELGHPILGDSYYLNSNRLKIIQSSELRKSLSHLNRLGLHAFELGFNHPVSKKNYHFICPWPEELTPLFKRLDLDEHLPI